MCAQAEPVPADSAAESAPRERRFWRFPPRPQDSRMLNCPRPYISFLQIGNQTTRLTSLISFYKMNAKATSLQSLCCAQG